MLKLDQTALAVLAAALALGACLSTPAVTPAPPCVDADAESASAAPSVALTSGPTALVMGGTASITAAAGPLPGACTWSSSDPAVVSIAGPGDADSTVTVRGGRVGVATISVMYSHGSGPPVTDALEIAVVELDLGIAGVSEMDEETVGGFIPLAAPGGGLREITLGADSSPLGAG